jgi:hypothetical protein
MSSKTPLTICGRFGPCVLKVLCYLGVFWQIIFGDMGTFCDIGPKGDTSPALSGRLYKITFKYTNSSDLFNCGSFFEIKYIPLSPFG